MKVPGVKQFLKNRNKLFVLLVIIISVSVGLLVTAYSQIDTSTQSSKFSTYADVQPANGSNLTAGFDSGMKFGRIGEGSAVTKTIDLTSSNLALVESYSTGNVSEGLKFEEKILFTGNRSVEYRYNASEPGYYNGSINLDIESANNFWGEKWLELQYYLSY
jgi:hypothetical protein